MKKFMGRKGIELPQLFAILAVVSIGVLFVGMVLSTKIKQDELSFREIEIFEMKNTFYLLNRSLTTTWLISTAQVLFKAGESGLDPTITFEITCEAQCKNPNGHTNGLVYRNSACAVSKKDANKGCGGATPVPDSGGNEWCAKTYPGKGQCCCGDTSAMPLQKPEETTYWYKTDNPNDNPDQDSPVVLPSENMNGERCNNGNPYICLPQNINFKNYFMYPGVGKMYEYLEIPGTTDSLSIKSREIKINPFTDDKKIYGFFWPAYDRVISDVAPKIEVKSVDTEISTQTVEHNDIYTDFQKMIKAGWMTVGIATQFRTEVDNGRHLYSGGTRQSYENRIKGLFEAKFNGVNEWLGTWSMLPVKWDAASGSNYLTASRGTNDIDAIVIHYCGGSYESCKGVFKNPNGRNGVHVSAHYVISKKGEITEMVREQDIAWHATYYNSRSIGIELEGSGHPDDYTDEMYNSLSNLIYNIMSRYPKIKEANPLHPIDIATYPGCSIDVPGIVGHEQVQPAAIASSCGFSAKSDPGPNFDWNKLISKLSGQPQTTLSGLKAGYVSEPYNSIFIDASSRYGAPPALIAAIFKCGEHSAFRTGDVGNAAIDLAAAWPDSNGPWATSPAGAKGPFQFTDPTWHDYGVDCSGDGTNDVQNLQDAACGASNMLKRNIDSNSGDYETKIRKAIFRYNHADWYVSRVYACYQLMQGGALQQGIFSEWKWKNLELKNVDGKIYLHYNATITFSEGESKPAIKMGGELVWPTTGRAITSCYADRSGGTWAGGDWHGGIDFGVPVGSAVYAASDGEVVLVENGCSDTPDQNCNHGFGNQVTIKHVHLGIDFYTQYAHLKKNSIVVGRGDKVNAGQKIAESGNSGYSTGPHLHFEINTGPEKKDETSINPCLYMDCDSSTLKKCPKTPEHGIAVNDNQMPQATASIFIDNSWSCDNQNIGRYYCRKADDTEVVNGKGPYILFQCKLSPPPFPSLEYMRNCMYSNCGDCFSIEPPQVPDQEIRVWPTGVPVAQSQLNKFTFVLQDNELKSCWGMTNGEKNYELKIHAPAGTNIYPIEDGRVAKVCRLGENDPTCNYREFGNYIVLEHTSTMAFQTVPGQTGALFYTQYNHLGYISPYLGISWNRVIALGRDASRDSGMAIASVGDSEEYGIMVFIAPNYITPDGKMVFRYTSGRDPLCLFPEEYLNDVIVYTHLNAPLDSGVEITASANVILPPGDELQACLDSLARKNCDYLNLQETTTSGNYYYHDEENNIFEKEPFTLKFNIEDWIPVG